MNKNQWKQSFQNRRFKSGSYSMGVAAAAVAIVVLINLIVNALPASMTKFDLSYNQMYSLTDTTKDYVKALEEDITIYVIAQTGTEDTDVMEMLDNYKALSGHIKVETVDPILHPNFVSQYTTETVSNRSMVVVSDKRHKIINYSDLYETSMDYTTYQTQTTGFDAEGQITSALNYVSTDILPTVYTLTGHSESELSDSLLELIGKSNITTESLNLLTAETVPGDADCVMINAPMTDISAEEAQKLLDYLESGGTAFIVDGSTEIKKPNLESVMEYYGLAFQRGMIVESNSNNFFYPYPYYLAPDMNSHEITSSLISGKLLAFLPFSQGIEILDGARSSISATPILTTSDSSFLRVPENSSSTSITKMDGDLDGPFHVGVAVTESHDEVETKLAVFGSYYVTDDSANSQVNGSNYKLVVDALNWACDTDDSISIAAKTFTLSALQITSAEVNKWMIIIVIIIPLATLVFGFIVWFRRRRR